MRIIRSLRGDFRAALAHRLPVKFAQLAALAAVAWLGLATAAPVFAQFEVTVSVPAEAEWFDTRVFLEAGDSVIFVKVHGGWVNATGAELKGPDGWGGPHEGTYVAGAPLAGLIGRIGDTTDEMFYVDLRGLGSEGRFVHKAARRGSVFLALNDVPGTYSDNQGAMSVTLMPRVARVPDLTGMTPEEADRLLRGRFHSVVAQPVVREHSERPFGRISSQDPAPGTPAAGLERVVVGVSDGPAPVRVPRIVGLAEDEALSRLARSGLKGNSVQPPTHSTMQRGTVLTADPEARSTVPRGSTVNYTTASGSNIVPDVRRKPPQDAIAELRAAGFAADEVSNVEDAELAGLVVSSKPPPGTIAELGSSVSLTVGVAPAPREPEDKEEPVASPPAVQPQIPSQPTTTTPPEIPPQDPPDSNLVWIVIGVITATTATTLVLWPKVRWSVDLDAVRSRNPENDPSVAGPEISFRIEVVPGDPPGEFSIPVKKEE